MAVPVETAITPRELRQRLQEEFAELLKLHPRKRRGSPACGCRKEAKFPLLGNILSFVATFRQYYPKERVLAILNQEGGLAAILCGESHFLHQRYID